MLFEQPSKQTIELITESSSLVENNLVVKQRQGQNNRAAQLDIEIFKGNSQQVRPVELP